MRSRWPLGHLAYVFGVSREAARQPGLPHRAGGAAHRRAGRGRRGSPACCRRPWTAASRTPSGLPGLLAASRRLRPSGVPAHVRPARAPAPSAGTGEMGEGADHEGCLRKVMRRPSRGVSAQACSRVRPLVAWATARWPPPMRRSSGAPPRRTGRRPSCGRRPLPARRCREHPPSQLALGARRGRRAATQREEAARGQAGQQEDAGRLHPPRAPGAAPPSCAGRRAASSMTAGGWALGQLASGARRGRRGWRPPWPRHMPTMPDRTRHTQPRRRGSRGAGARAGALGGLTSSRPRRSAGAGP